MVFPAKVLSLPSPEEIEISVFGPGYGESIVIHVPGEGWGIIDCCTTMIDGKKVVLPLQYLKELYSDDIPDLSFIMLTHPHKDHYAGFSELIAEFSGKIKRACLYAGDSLREYTAYLSRLSVAEKNIPHFAKVYSAFHGLFKSGTQVRSLEELTTVFDTDTTIGSKNVPIKLIALSPSAKSKYDYNSILRASIPKSGMPFHPVADSSHNLVSVATLLKVGDLQFVFGSDLEVGEDDTMGWRCVLSNQDIPSVAAKVVKVAHHGSKNAFHAPAWNEHSADGKPLSIITPFNRSTPQLPTDDGLDDIIQASAQCAVTMLPNLSSKIDSVYPKDVSMIAKQFTKSWHILPQDVGAPMVRTRLSLTGEITEQLSSYSAKWLKAN